MTNHLSALHFALVCAPPPHPISKFAPLGRARSVRATAAAAPRGQRRPALWAGTAQGILASQLRDLSLIRQPLRGPNLGRLRAWTFRITSCASRTVLGSSSVCSRRWLKQKAAFSRSCGFMELAGGIFTFRISDCRPLHSNISFTCTSDSFQAVSSQSHFTKATNSTDPSSSDIQTVSCVLP